jgi:hypothetical protein
LARLSARFSFSDLPDFLAIACLGDLSDIAAPFDEGAGSGPDPSTLRSLGFDLNTVGPRRLHRPQRCNVKKVGNPASPG